MDAAERLVRVAHLRRFGKSIKKIAETLLAHRSTIARDLKALGLVGRFDKHLSVDQIDAHVLFAIKHTHGAVGRGGIASFLLGNENVHFSRSMVDAAKRRLNCVRIKPSRVRRRAFFQGVAPDFMWYALANLSPAARLSPRLSPRSARLDRRYMDQNEKLVQYGVKLLMAVDAHTKCLLHVEVVRSIRG